MEYKMKTIGMKLIEGDSIVLLPGNLSEFIIYYESVENNSKR